LGHGQLMGGDADAGALSRFKLQASPSTLTTITSITSVRDSQFYFDLTRIDVIV
jgi:hypothetical protein